MVNLIIPYLIWEWEKKELSGKLPKEQFVMAERGYIVNLLHVERLEKGMLTMDNGDLIKVGRGHNREIMQKMSYE